MVLCLLQNQLNEARLHYTKARELLPLNPVLEENLHKLNRAQTAFSQPQNEAHSLGSADKASCSKNLSTLQHHCRNNSQNNSGKIGSWLRNCSFYHFLIFIRSWHVSMPQTFIILEYFSRKYNLWDLQDDIVGWYCEKCHKLNNNTLWSWSLMIEWASTVC